MASSSKSKEFLTTSQAAKLLSVSPDTVLKWVKAGKIQSTRTLGGHFRIPIEVLEKVSQRGQDAVSLSNGFPSIDYQYCWEFLAHGGQIKPECRDCITYRSRSRRCYELRDLPEGMGCLRVYCRSDCSECNYFKMVSGLGYNILMLSENRRMFRDWEKIDDNGELNIRLAGSEYECSAIIQDFRPDYIVVDCALGKKRTGTVCNDLFNDNRLPVVRIILASRIKQLNEYCDKKTCGWITKPFDIKQLKSCISGTG